ncbi:MAG: hypothetical protein JSR80_05935 [Verrucomicrobia bacterium]|nr:hypothetical protein [Verrucomicrobiota bacterium]
MSKINAESINWGIEHACRALITYYGFKTNRISFGVGVILGSGAYATGLVETPSTCYHKKSGDSTNANACGVDIFDQLSGAKMPGCLRLIVAGAIAITHIDHKLIHRYNPFIPLAGWTVGCYVAVQAHNFGKKQKWCA